MVGSLLLSASSEICFRRKYRNGPLNMITAPGALVGDACEGAGDIVIAPNGYLLEHDAAPLGGEFRRAPVAGVRIARVHDASDS
jgi:hypothetical protein